MRESALRLDQRQRQLIEQEIADRCATRGWTLFAVNCRTNHVHVVVHASQHPNLVRNDLKARCTYRLKAHSLESAQRIPRERFWTEGGSQRYLNNDDGLEAAIRYVRDAQDHPRV
ncbi:MAG: transposase [Pirellulales bacterium]|nr:transposase [Pirellulales bacterium]